MDRMSRWLVVGLMGAIVCVSGIGVGAAAPQEPGQEGQANLASQLFADHGQCLSCHSGYALADVPIAYPWRSSMMANSARDPYWQGSVRGEVMDHPELQAAIEDKCATCHLPMARFGAAQAGEQGRVFHNLQAAGIGVASPPLGDGAAVPAPAALAADGVSCTVCHQIRPENFGDPESFSGHFEVDTDRRGEGRAVLGPYDVDAGRRTIMSSATGYEATRTDHLKESELCATCHTLYTNYVDRDGEQTGRLPEQVPYLEWLHSDYRTEKSCQDCHMPEVEGTAPVTSVVGQPRERVSRHAFRGGNRYMLSILQHYRNELGVVATEAELREAVAQTDDNLRTGSASLHLESLERHDGLLEAEVRVENRTGHKLPTAYPSRRVWLHFTVRDADGTVLFESGAPATDGAIADNDNDLDASRYEPHYRVIERPDQVQIYEPIMVDTRDQVTTGLLFGARYAKDNRLLPRGFDPATAGADVAVHGRADGDDDFTGGSDGIRYRVPVPISAGPLRVDVELLYQSIAYRWARNLGRHEAPEIDRFLGMHEATAGESAVVLSRVGRSLD